MTFTYHVPQGAGWSGPLTYAEVTGRRPERTEAEWRRFEDLESTVGRDHEAGPSPAEVCATLADLSGRLLRFEPVDPAEIRAFEQRRDALLGADDG